MPDAIHIADLAEPHFTPEVDEILPAMGTMAPDCELDADALQPAGLGRDRARPTSATATTRSASTCCSPRCARSPTSPTPAWSSQHSQLLQLLKNRLLLVDLLSREPGILERRARAADHHRRAPPHRHDAPPPAARHRHLAADAPLLGEPRAVPAARRRSGVEPDPRRARTDAAVWFMNEAMPLFPLMHEMTTDHIHEEIQLLAIDFSTMFFETLASVPAWRDYYRAHDQRPHYRYLRTVLQALQPPPRRRPVAAQVTAAPRAAARSSPTCSPTPPSS